MGPCRTHRRYPLSTIVFARLGPARSVLLCRPRGRDKAGPKGTPLHHPQASVRPGLLLLPEPGLFFPLRAGAHHSLVGRPGQAPYQAVKGVLLGRAKPGLKARPTSPGDGSGDDPGVTPP